MGELTDKVSGKVEELKGKATGSKTSQVKGKAKQARGAVKGKLNDLKDDMRTSGERDAPAGDGYVATRETSGV